MDFTLLTSSHHFVASLVFFLEAPTVGGNAQTIKIAVLIGVIGISTLLAYYFINKDHKNN